MSFYTDICANKMAVIVTGLSRGESGSQVMPGMYRPTLLCFLLHIQEMPFHIMQ